MRQDEFKHRYHDIQKGIKAPEALKAHTISAAKHVAQAHVAEPTSNRRWRHGMKTVPSRMSGVSGAAVRALPRIGVAAIVIIAALAIVLLLFVSGGTFGAPFGAGTSSSLFTVKAYAAESGSTIDADEEGRIIFPLDLQTAFQGASAANGEGIYTGSILSIEGNDIQRVQVTLVGGELYSYTFDEFIAREHPDKMSELEGWKPTKRGMGEYYGKYDYVSFTEVDDECSHADSEKTVQARLIKRLGSTIDIAAEDGCVPLLGLWFSDDAVQLGPLGVDPQSLAGKTLTVTVEFADGRCQTQQIGLRAGTFRVEKAAYDATSASDIKPVEGPLPNSDVAGEDLAFMLFGVVESSSDTLHPFPLDNANEHADAPVNVMPLSEALEARGSVESVPLAGDARTTDAAGHHETEVWLTDSAGETNTLSRAYLENIEARVTDHLPEGYDIFKDTDVVSFLGDLEYYNACRQITHGYTVSADGMLADGFSYLVVSMDVKGATFGTTYRYARASELVVPAAICEDGTVLRSTIDAFGCHVDDQTSDFGNWDWVVVSDDTARRVEIVCIVSDDLLQKGRLALELKQLDENANDETACKPYYVLLQTA